MEQHEICVDRIKENDSLLKIQEEYDILCKDIQQLESQAKNPLLRLFKKQARKEALEALREKKREIGLHKDLYELRLVLMRNGSPECLVDSVGECIRLIRIQQKIDDKAALLAIDSLIESVIDDFSHSLRAQDDRAVLEHQLQWLKEYIGDRGNEWNSVYYKDDRFVECSLEKQKLTRMRILLEKEFETLYQRMKALKKDAANPELGLDIEKITERTKMIQTQALAIQSERTTVENLFESYDRMLQEIKKQHDCQRPIIDVDIDPNLDVTKRCRELNEQLHQLINTKIEGTDHTDKSDDPKVNYFKL